MKTASDDTKKPRPTKIQRITAAIQKDKAIMKQLKAMDMEPDHLAHHALRYISAIKQGRAICMIHSVSASGMTRTMSFHECAKYKTPLNCGQTHGYLNFWSLFKALGYPVASNGNGFKIQGCGMDMVFATNYNVIHELCSLKACTTKERDRLAQNTPTAL